jgi:hypothetical protein
LTALLGARDTAGAPLIFSLFIKEKILMSQNLVTLNISPDDLAAIAAAITTLQEKLGGLIELSVDQRRSLTKMGDKSEAFCRQTLIVLAQNKQIIPPELDLAEAERDLHNLDLLRPHLASLRQLVGKADDTEMALGSDILTPRSRVMRWPRSSARAPGSMP